MITVSWRESHLQIQENNALNKTDLLVHLSSLLNSKIEVIKRDIASTNDSRNSDTKSSAGDKHEVGRALIQQELDQLDAQLAKTRLLRNELDRIPLDRKFDRVASGSLVETNSSSYFISIGLGRITFEDQPVSVISLASPIGQLLHEKVVGDVISFNGKEVKILTIE